MDLQVALRQLILKEVGCEVEEPKTSVEFCFLLHFNLELIQNLKGRFKKAFQIVDWFGFVAINNVTRFDNISQCYIKLAE